MSLRGFFSALALSALAVTGITPVATAADAGASDFVSGVIVQYADGISPTAPNGEPTGANFLKGVYSSEDLGSGLYLIKLAQPIYARVAKSWVEKMKLDQRIQWADLNYEVKQTSATFESLKIPVLAKARAASGPRSLVARPALATGAKDRARVRLSWYAPANRYGAKIVGYRVQYSTNGGSSYQTLINDTRSNSTSIFVSDGIRAGVPYRFVVRAITNNGSGSNTLGSASNAASALVRTYPKPVVITSGPRVGPGNVSYFEQSLSDRGGFSQNQLRYRAVATATDIESVESSLCSATRCRFPDLLPDITYKVEIIATNPIGKSSSLDVVGVDDTFFSLQWYLTGQYGISMPSAWKYSKGDGDKVVAVIDTGIKSHEQIDKSLTRNADGTIYGYDLVSDVASAADGDAEDPNPNDEGGDVSGSNSFHGTHVSGIIAAQHDYLGTAGVAPNVKILPVRALGRDGGTVADLLKAVNWAAGVKISGLPINKFQVSVINLSLGAKEELACSDGYASIFKAVASRGISVVAAAGNEGRPSLSFPANCPGVIAVAASQALGDKASYSNTGDAVLISAPGGEIAVGSLEAPDSQGAILSSWIDESNLQTYRIFEGTSMAAPVVSGIIALMYSMHPKITPSRVRSILANSVQPFGPGTVCATTGGCGSGIVNAQLALARTARLK